MAHNNEKKEETDFIIKSKSLFTGPFLTVIFNIIVFAIMGVFLVGVYKTETQNLKDKLGALVQQVEADKVMITKLSAVGSDPVLKRVDALERKTETLENIRSVLEQKDQGLGKDINGLDSRVTRLEDAIPKIALMNQKMEVMDRTIGEIKTDLKELPKIQIQLVELKALIQQSK